MTDNSFRTIIYSTRTADEIINGVYTAERLRAYWTLHGNPLSFTARQGVQSQSLLINSISIWYNYWERKGTDVLFHWRSSLVVLEKNSKKMRLRCTPTDFVLFDFFFVDLLRHNLHTELQYTSHNLGRKFLLFTCIEMRSSTILILEFNAQRRGLNLRLAFQTPECVVLTAQPFSSGFFSRDVLKDATAPSS